jgi:hypothetical protein
MFHPRTTCHGRAFRVMGAWWWESSSTAQHTRIADRRCHTWVIIYVFGHEMAPTSPIAKSADTRHLSTHTHAPQRKTKKIATKCRDLVGPWVLFLVVFLLMFVSFGQGRRPGCRSPQFLVRLVDTRSCWLI